MYAGDFTGIDFLNFFLYNNGYFIFVASVLSTGVISLGCGWFEDAIIRIFFNLT